MPASDSESDFITTDGRHKEPSHGRRNERCRSCRDCPQLPPTPHRLARHLPLCESSHHPNNERLHVVRCRYTAQDPPNSPLPHRHHSRQSTCKRTCFCSVFFLTDGLTGIRFEISPFKLHGSRTAVVSLTRAATQRQLVMFIVDKVVEEDRGMLVFQSR